MDTNEQSTQPQMEQPTPQPMHITEESANDLKQTGKWTKFLSILGFIYIGFMVLFSIFMGSIFSSLGGGMYEEAMPSAFMGIIYFIFALIYFFPVLFLFKFSTAIKRALSFDNKVELVTAFRNLRQHYQFVGILAIISLVLSAIGLLFALISAIFIGAATL